jgi:hypothetical protein
MRYKITIRRRNGVLLTKETTSREVINGYARTAESYGDKVLRIEEKAGENDFWQPMKALGGLVLAGATVGIGLGVLGALGKALKK